MTTVTEEDLEKTEGEGWIYMTNYWSWWGEETVNNEKEKDLTL